MFDKIFIQRTYANLVGPRLELFRIQQHAPYRANFRCHICGDSQKNKYKKRGFFLEKEGSIVYYCHNQCGTINFENYLETYHGDLYVEYKFELIKEWKEDKQREREQESRYQCDPVQVEVENMDDTDDVAEVNVAKKYLADRQIPEKFWNDIHYTDHFYQYVNSKLTDKFPEEYEKRIDRRVLFPLRDEEQTIFGVIGRSIEPDSNLRYITIKFDETKPKIFGLDRLDRSQLAYVCEGPIDSFFIDNCIALAGTDGSPDLVFSDSSKYVMVLDNQPRSESVLKKYEKYIRRGCQVFIWPDSVVGKDINDLIKDGMDQQQLMKMIRLNTYSGFKLQLMFKQWRKI